MYKGIEEVVVGAGMVATTSDFPQPLQVQ